jgi:hypothetical protein
MITLAATHVIQAITTVEILWLQFPLTLRVKDTSIAVLGEGLAATVVAAATLATTIEGGE